MNIAFILIVVLCYSSLTSDAKTVQDYKDPVLPGDIDPALLDLLEDDAEGTKPPQHGLYSGRGLKTCLRLRVLRMLLRVLLVRASGFNINQLRQRTEADSNPEGQSSSSSVVPTSSTTTSKQGLSSDDLEQICNELCELGLCPPGCPQDNLPPWGRR